MRNFIFLLFILTLLNLLAADANGQLPVLMGLVPPSGFSNSYNGPIFKINGDGTDVISCYDGYTPSTRIYDPIGTLLKVNNGKIYGLSPGGGMYNWPFTMGKALCLGNDCGELFSVDSDGNNSSNIYQFNGIDGGNPTRKLIRGQNGLLYGMTSYGGLDSSGVIFSFNISSNTYSVLFQFHDSLGAVPIGELLQANNGKLYGLTSQGGNSNDGVIFSFDLINNSYTKLFDFNDTVGSSPYGGLIQANDGRLYGMTYVGPSSWGTLFCFDLASNTYTMIQAFVNTGDNGKWPVASLIQGADSKLYGMTSGGGGEENGCIFSCDTLNVANSIDPFGYNVSTIYGFNDPGAYPMGSLIQGTDGLLYGMLQGGLTDNTGSAFSFNPVNRNYTRILSFDSIGGGSPMGDFIQVGVINNNCHAIFTLGSDSSNPGKYITNNQSTGNNLYYLWQFGDGDTSTQKQPVHTYLASGIYNACLEVSNDSGCVNTHCDSVYCNLSTNISELSLNNCNIWPNPANSAIAVTVDNTIEGATLTINDLTGQRLTEIKLLAEQTKVNTAFLSDGIYVLAVTKDDHRFTKKITIIH